MVQIKYFLTLTFVLPTDKVNVNAKRIDKRLDNKKSSPNFTAPQGNNRAESKFDLDSIINSGDDDDYFPDITNIEDTTIYGVLESESFNDENVEETGNYKYESCVVVSECAFCTGSESNISEECKATGRLEKIICNVSSTGKSKKKENTKYRSCKRTQRDEESLVLRLQFICIVTAFFSLRSVRREKLMNASLFDQRTDKRRSPFNLNNNNTTHYTEVRQVQNDGCIDMNLDGNNKAKDSDGVEKLENKV